MTTQQDFAPDGSGTPSNQVANPGSRGTSLSGTPIPGVLPPGAQFRGRGGPAIAHGPVPSMGVSGGVPVGIGAAGMRGRGGFAPGRGGRLGMGMGIGRGAFIGPDGGMSPTTCLSLLVLELTLLSFSLSSTATSSARVTAAAQRTYWPSQSGEQVQRSRQQCTSG